MGTATQLSELGARRGPQGEAMREHDEAATRRQKSAVGWRLGGPFFGAVHTPPKYFRNPGTRRAWCGRGRDGGGAGAREWGGPETGA